MEGISYYAGVGFWLKGKARCACIVCVPEIPVGVMMMQKPIFLSSLIPNGAIGLYCHFCGIELVSETTASMDHRDGEVYMTVDGKEWRLGKEDEVDEVIYQDGENEKDEPIDPEVDRKFRDIVSSM